MSEAKGKKYQPTRLEVAKTVTIAVLITGVIAFIAGARYEANHQGDIARALHSNQAHAEAPTSK